MEKNFKKNRPEGIKKLAEDLYCVTPRLNMGQINAEQLQIINKIVQDYSLETVKITAAQQIKLTGIKEKDIEGVLARLKNFELHDSKYLIQTCAGAYGCRFCLLDCVAVARELEDILTKYENLPAKIKTGISSCTRTCAQSLVRDVGLLATKKGWALAFGGNAGRKPRIADILARHCSQKQLLKHITAILDFYCQNAKDKERTARFVERVGLNAIIKVCPQ